jgi:hypothetical protein
MVGGQPSANEEQQTRPAEPLINGDVAPLSALTSLYFLASLYTAFYLFPPIRWLPISPACQYFSPTTHQKKIVALRSYLAKTRCTFTDPW